ncbi:MAG: aldehyde ferredoxin oxidoreductase family protein [Anaerolineae bacterium]
MAYGYNGRILHVDLTGRRITTEEPPEEFYRRYLGGRALVAYYLLREMAPGADPLGPENVLVFAPGVITGSFLSGQGRNGVGAKSPLTNAFGNAEVGGFWGAELKRAGFDAIVIRGRAERPVYLWVHQGQAEIRDAAHLWGKTTGETEDLIRQELGDRAVRTALIGPAGERLVRYACVVNDRSHFAGRTGLGAVMGAKNLKGIAVRAPQGKGLMEVADPRGVQAMARWMGANLDKVSGLHDAGTAGGLRALHKASGLPTFNFRAGSFEGHEAITGQRMRDTILVRRETCFACAVRCKRVVEVKEPYRVDPQYGGPEYETLAALGSNAGIADLLALAKANEMCAAYGLDTISAGATIAFAMECFERGLLTIEDTGGIELRFGDAAAMLKILELVIRREGMGDLLAEGVWRAAQEIGQGAEEFALHVKGQELPMHEPRIKHALGVGYAVSPTGADHMHNMHDTLYRKETESLRQLRAFGPFQPLPAEELGEDKMRLFFHHVNWRHFLDCVVMCDFLPYDPPQMADIVRAVTGWDVDIWELLRVGERAATMARAFNAREGFTRQDDTLPQRFFQPFTHGSSDRGTPLSRQAFEEAKETYYKMMGWDPTTGIPTADRLRELDIGWMAAELST